ncbi:uncharacterized protein LOC142844586 [Microtus pennsylvanicus]|uniref:uncharacterized protein LOC142844586 n=1 Tax=Microtus pennsylvanicus TaxID=10058 RepID=UPI003F6CF5F4
MLKMAKKLKARAAESERKTAAAAAEVAAEAAVAAAALAEQKNGDPEKPPKSVKIPVNAGHDVPPEKLLSDKERKKLEKKLLEQRKKEEKKREKERKKFEKMMMKKKKNVPESRSEARGPEVTAAATAATAAGEDEGAAQGAAAGAGLGEGAAAAGGTSRAWAQWDTDSDEDDAYYAPPRVGGVVWRPGPAKAGALSAHMPLVVFLVFSIRSPSWVLNFLLQRRTEQGRGCGFVFGATCCFRVFLGCAFFSFLSGRTKRRGRGRGRSRARGTGRRGRDERLI